ncbi:hypothetical protein [Streptomyces sp. SAJ15]|uniref:hypothetical protein n=1 Tax=Streptomyces sp. SAJ15 TaxID=2011095 RepID=UPI001184E980|nr:hypothetical protein [Streptomyces sp. SAJ15]TVL89829.1 hypothetical protein CD790_25895 [Streptomyces sp. SAJ15]
MTTSNGRLSTPELLQFLGEHATNPPYIPERDDAPAPLSSEREDEIRALLAELDRVRADRDADNEAIAFLERATLPELRRDIERHKAGKQRWRNRAEKAEAERDELKKQVAALEMERHETNEALAGLTVALRAAEAAIGGGW